MPPRNLVLALVVLGLSIAPIAPTAAQAPAASALLTSARAAIGGDAKVRALQSLRLTGSQWSSQGVHGGYTEDTEGPLEIRFAFPDRFIKVAATPVSGGVLEEQHGFNGVKALMPSFAAPSQAPRELIYARKIASELLLGILGRTEIWGGLTVAADGATAIRVTGPENYSARLEFDPSTHLPVRLVYRERRQVRPTNTIRLKGTPNDPALHHPEAAGARGGGSGASAADLPDVEIVVAFRDRVNVSGFQLPQRITWTAKGVDLWEYRLTSLVINSPMTAADFGG